jgi:hypothetical protein
VTGDADLEDRPGTGLPSVSRGRGRLRRARGVAA